MRFLLDTHFVLWIPVNSSNMSSKSASIIRAPESELFFSVSSIWEIAIKKGLNRRNFQVDPREIRRRLIENGYQELTIQSQHVVMVDSMPPIHKDPFDRILIAQAMVEGITLLTADPVIAKYPGPIRKM
jgi:PIN domain nuclease of toxin-antitoxin system